MGTFSHAEQPSARVRIETALRQRIQTGEYAVGDRLPTIFQLTEEFGVNGVQTVRDAYRPLIAEGLVEARQGAGYFLARSAPRPLGPTGEFPFPGAANSPQHRGVFVMLTTDGVAKRIAAVIAMVEVGAAMGPAQTDCSARPQVEAEEIMKRHVIWFNGGVQLLPSGWIRACRRSDNGASEVHRAEVLLAPGEVAALYAVAACDASPDGQQISETRAYMNQMEAEWTDPGLTPRNQLAGFAPAAREASQDVHPRVEQAVPPTGDNLELRQPAPNDHGAPRTHKAWARSTRSTRNRSRTNGHGDASRRS